MASTFRCQPEALQSDEHTRPACTLVAIAVYKMVARIGLNGLPRVFRVLFAFDRINIPVYGASLPGLMPVLLKLAC